MGFPTRPSNVRVYQFHHIPIIVHFSNNLPAAARGYFLLAFAAAALPLLFALAGCAAGFAGDEVFELTVGVVGVTGGAAAGCCC